MAEITAALVKDLREKTGAGMMDCKKALAETAGDLEAAVDWLRKKGLAAAAKKAGRLAAEGLVGVIAEGSRGAVVEVNSETDFVARNETFQEFVSTVTAAALAANGDLEGLKARPYPGTERDVAGQLTELIGTIGENMTLRRCAALTVEQGVVASYMHAATAPNLGRIGVLVALKSSGDVERLAPFGRQLAMHVAAAQPQFLTIADVDPAVLERERQIATEKAVASGKPPEIVEKMVEGRIRKEFFEETVFLEQVYVIDQKTKISKVVEGFAKDLGSPVELVGFERFALGEGLEKSEEDLASAVAATLNKSG